MDVRDVMSRDVITVRPETPLKEVARLMVAHGISGLPVVDDTGLVVGVVSEADFVIKERGVEGIHRRLLARLVGDSPETETEFAKVVAERAGSAMTSPPITVGPRTPLRDAATLMVDRRINRLPVLDGTRLVGIVSRADLVRAYLRLDADLEAVIREGVLGRELWQEDASHQVTVTVRDGVAHLAGNVDRRSSAGLIVEHVGAVEGVVGVESDLTWTLDDTEIDAPQHDFVSPYTVS